MRAVKPVDPVEKEVDEEEGEESGKSFDKYEIEGWARTLIEAEEIKSDPKKMKAVNPLLEKKSKAINSIDQLRKLAVEKGAI